MFLASTTMDFIYPFLFFAIIFPFFFFRWILNNNSVPYNFPIVGMLPTLMFSFHSVHDKISKILEKHNGTFIINCGFFSSVNMLITSNPENLHYISSRNFSNFPKGIKSKEISDVFGDSLFNDDFEPWRRHRKIIYTYLHHPKFWQFLGEIMNENLNKGLIPFLDYFCEKKLILDLEDLFERLISDIACTIVLGYNPKSLTVQFSELGFSSAINDAFEAIFFRHILPENVWKFLRWVGIGYERKLSIAKKFLFGEMEKIMSSTREISELKGNEKTFDVLKCYMTGHEVVGSEKISDNIIGNNSIGFIAATKDTTSSALTWFFWLVSKNTLVERKIRMEIEKNFSGLTEEMWDPKELGRLVYLHAAFCESLRLYPPVPFHNRIAMEQDVLPSGHCVKPDSRILLSAYAMGRMKSMWGEDCLEFRPERWIGDDGMIKHEGSQKFSVFSSGPRSCPGKELAFILAKSVIVTILFEYDLEVMENQDVSPKPGVIMHTKNGLMTRIKKRCT